MSGELQNVPPVWTAAFHWLACLTYLLLLPRRAKVSHCWFLMAAVLAALCPYMIAVAPLSGVPFNLGMAGFALLTSLPFLLLAQGGIYNQVYYAARAFILGAFAVSLAWQFYSFYAPRAAWLAPSYAEMPFMLLFGGAVFAVMFLLERGHRKEMEEMSVSRQACAGAVLIALAVYIVSSISYASPDTPFSTVAETAEAFNIRSMVYLGGVAILYAHHLQLCDTYALREIGALQNVLNMQYANYQQSQEAIELVNRKYHDLKHQIAVLRSDIGSGEKLEYLDQMEREIRAYEAQNKTGNEVLDTILTGKSIFCQSHGIRFTCVADGHALDFMGVMDLSALFGNALDNAIEGVGKVDDPEQRLIHLSVSRQKRFLRILVKNRCAPEVTAGNGLPGTTKKDRQNHGYGLKSIRATAEKYGGSAAVHVSDGWFELRVLIPLS